MPTSPLKAVLDQVRRTGDREATRDLDDADLLDLFRRRREDAAFALLVQRHGPMVLGICRRLLGSLPDAEDAFQATFLVLVRKAGSIRRQQSLAGWLYGVAYRVALKARERSARRRAHEREAAVAMHQPDSTDALIREELRAALDEAIGQLPARYRSPLVLCCLEGKTHEQAARELAWPKSSVSARLGRARQLLQQRLARRGFTVTAAALAAALAGKQAMAVPARLTLATARLASQALTGLPATPAGAVALADSIVAGMTAKRWIVTLVLVLTASLFVAGVGLVAAPRPEAPGAPEAPAAAGPPKPADEPLPPEAVLRLGSGRLQHGGGIGTLAFSPDGKTLVSLGDNRLRVWDATTGRLRKQAALGYWAGAVAFRDNHTLVVASGKDRSDDCRLLDADTGTERGRLALAAPISVPAVVAFSADARWAAVGNQPDAVLLFDLAAGKLARRIPVPARAPTLAFTPDGTSLALVDGGGTLHLHDTGTGNLRARWKPEGADGLHLKFSPDGSLLAVLKDDVKDALTVWDVAARKELRRLPSAGWTSCAFSPDGKLLATCNPDRDPGVSLWDVTTGRKVRGLPADVYVTAVAFTADGRTLAVAGGGGAVTLWDVASGRRLPVSATPTRPVDEMCITADGTRLLGQAADLITWDLATGREVRRLPRKGPGDVRVLSPDGALLASPMPDGGIALCDAATGQTLRTLRAPGQAHWTLRFSPDGRILGHAGHDGTIRLWETATGREVRSLTGPPGFLPPLRLAVAPDGRWVATCSGRPQGESVVLLWDVAAGREVRRLTTRHRDPMVLCFSPDGRRLALTSGDMRMLRQPGALQVWDVATGAEWRSFDTGLGPLTALAFSPDGRMLATGGESQVVCLWELASGRKRHEFTGHDGWVYAVAFSPDGRRLAAASPDAPVLVWDVTGDGSPRRPLSPAELRSCWEDLADDDAAVAFRAVRRLAADPGRMLPLLRERLRPVPPADGERIRRLVKDLDSDQFDLRRRAVAELAAMADVATPVLRKELETASSAEVRRALRDLLDRQDEMTPGRLRTTRAVEALEWAATPEATRLLEELAGGAAGASLTRDAAAARDRIRTARR